MAANEAYMVAYRAKNKAKILAKEAERYQRKKDSIIKSVNEYYQREKDLIRARAKRPDALRRKADQEALRRVLKTRGAEIVEGSWIAERDEGRCGICGKQVEGSYHIDHIWPLSRRGLHGERNLQLAHPKCNERKHNRLPTIEELEGP